MSLNAALVRHIEVWQRQTDTKDHATVPLTAGQDMHPMWPMVELKALSAAGGKARTPEELFLQLCDRLDAEVEVEGHRQSTVQQRPFAIHDKPAQPSPSPSKLSTVVPRRSSPLVSASSIASRAAWCFVFQDYLAWLRNILTARGDPIV